MLQKKEKLSIAMFGQRAPDDPSGGGVEVVVKELSGRLVTEGHRVTCYNRANNQVSKSAWMTEYKGVREKYVPTINRKGFAAASSSLCAAVACAIGKYDVVHIHAEGPAVMCWLPKLFGKKVIVTVHGLDWQRAKWSKGFGAKYIRFGERCAVRYADEIIVLSEAVRKYFEDTYGRKTILIPNGVNRPEKREGDLILERYGLQKEGYILSLGRLVPEKGLQYLIESFRSTKTDKKLVIAGGGSDTETYMQELKEMASGDDRILFTGFVHGQLLEELYSNAYVYVLPSDLEGMPLSLLEAMSYDNCCLVSDIAECTEVVEDKAVTFKKGDTEDLRRKLQQLCDGEAFVRKYREGAADFICKKCDWDAVAEKTLRLYMGMER